MTKSSGHPGFAKETKKTTKKCPECMEYMPLAARICPSCKLPVGKITKHGMAARKTDWKAYATAIVAWAFFFFYIWWAFLRE
jgi:predicted amidophosphoribosyltransferase